jgi:integrase
MQSHTIKHFSKLTRLANVREIHFHALRHTFLTNIANGIGMDAPVDIVKVMELAGHSDLKTTMIYVHSAGIKDTSSRLWSRAQRKELAQKVIPLKRKEAQA